MSQEEGSSGWVNLKSYPNDAGYNLSSVNCARYYHAQISVTQSLTHTGRDWSVIFIYLSNVGQSAVVSNTLVVCLSVSLLIDTSVTRMSYFPEWSNCKLTIPRLSTL